MVASPLQSLGRSRLRRTAVLTVAFAVLATCFLWLGGASRLINSFASSSIARHDFEVADSWLRFGSQIGCTSGESHFLSARIARHRGDFKTMSDELAVASRQGCANERVELERQLSQAQSGKLDEVEKALSENLSKGIGDLAEICEAYANGLSMASRFNDALSILEAWHRDLPNDPVPIYRIGRIQEHLILVDDAKASYRSAIELQENYYPALYSLARLLLDENNSEEAASLFERCLTMPNPAAASVGLALCIAKTDQLDRAKKLLYEVVALGSLTIQKSYAAVGEPMERFTAAAELGKLLVSESEFDEGLRLVELALSFNSRDQSARYVRAMALRGLNRNDEASEEIKKVEEVKNAFQKVNSLRNQIGRDPNACGLRVELGKLLMEYESERNGLFWLQSAIAQNPECAEAHLALAEYYESHWQESVDFAPLARSHREKVKKPTVPTSVP